MRDTRILVVQPMYRLLGPALVSQLRAFQEGIKGGIRLDIHQMWGKPAMLEDGHDIVTHKYWEAQTTFLQGDWWAMICIEDDMIIPLDTVTRLLALLAQGADIGFGLYAFRHGLGKWSAYTQVEEYSGVSLSDHPEEAQQAWGHTVSVAGVGLGCTIIRRTVLEKLTFHRRGQACNDWYLSRDAQLAGYTQLCDTGLVCGHLTMIPSPRVLWPIGEEPFVHTEFLTDEDPSSRTSNP